MLHVHIHAHICDPCVLLECFIIHCYRTEHLSVEDKQQHEVCVYIHTYIYSLTTIHACMSCGVVVHVLVIMLPL